MPTTRSQSSGAGTKQKASEPPISSKPTISTKRKAPSSKSPPEKKSKNKPTKQTRIEQESGKIETKASDDNEVDAKDEDNDGDDDTISINRAPVLELWSACIAQTMHPSLSWSTCLSIGSAISSITAISKGRSIGTIAKPDKTEQAAKRQKREAEEEELEEVEVMSFHLKLKDGEALVGDKTKKSNEEALRKKFGGEEGYEKVKGTIIGALEGWKGKEEELGQRGFRMYEDFRPNVAGGQKGWGRKGELRLKRVRDVVAG